MGNVLVRADDDHAARVAVDVTHVEDVAGARSGTEDLLMIRQPEYPLPRHQDRRHRVYGQTPMPLLEDGPDVDDRVGVGSGRRVPTDR